MATRWDRPTAVLLLAFAIYTAAAGWRMGYWQGRIPGPGFAPVWIGAGLALAALALLVRPPAAPARAAEPRPGPRTGRGVGRETALVIKIAAVTVAAVMLSPRLGMLTAVGLLLLALGRLLGGSWRAAVVTAVVVTAGLHAVFVRWLRVPLPTGPWGF